MLDGRTTDFASDFVLYHCEPAYRQMMDARFPKITEPVGERVGRRVRTLRRSRRMTLQQLAEAAGLTRGNASRLEAGKHEPRLETLVRVARALGVTVADLVTV
jgi:DNA-binding XRE family transcriptional regulator